MPENIETLLRDAGQSPTRQLDIGQVHVAGRRRARTRHLATGVSALALFGVVAVSVSVLLPETPDAPFVDQIPDEPEPTTGDGTTDDETDEVAVPELATTIARVTQDPELGFVVTLTAPDGTTTAFSTEPRARDDLAGSVLLDGDGHAVIASPVGDLVRSGPDGSTILAEGDAAAGTPWYVHGTTDQGEVLVSRVDLARNDVLQLIRGDQLIPWPLQPVEASMPEETFGAATAVGDRLLVTLTVGDSVKWLLYDGDAAPVEVLSSSTMPFDDVPHTPVWVGDELWHLETPGDVDGGRAQNLVLRNGDESQRIATPFGRDLDAFVGTTTVGQLADGSPALVLSSLVLEGSGPGPALLVDLDAARAAATTSGRDDEVPQGVFFQLGEPAHVLFTP